jgi:hypothetical protein
LAPLGGTRETILPVASPPAAVSPPGEISRRGCDMPAVMSDESQASADAVRASNDDREQVQVQGILRDALSQGRITPDKFAEGTMIAAEARTIGDLRPVLEDLPVAYAGSPAAAVVADSDVVEWRGTFGSIERKGAWTVPSKILIHRRMGSVELDFTEVQFTSPVTDIELDVIGGSIEIRVREGGASVSTDEIVVSMGSIEDHRKIRAVGLPAAAVPRQPSNGLVRSPGSAQAHVRLTDRAGAAATAANCTPVCDTSPGRSAVTTRSWTTPSGERVR